MSGTGIRDRHLEHFAEFARLMGPKTQTSDFPVARRALEPELDNLRAVLGWSLVCKQFDAGARLLASLATFFYDLGLNSEAVAQCERQIARQLLVERRFPIALEINRIEQN